MSEFNNQHTPPGEYLSLEFDNQTHWEDATFGMMITGYEDPAFGYAADVPTDLQPIFEDYLTPHLSPPDSHNSSPLTLSEEALWPPASEFGDNSPRTYFSFGSSSSTSSPVYTPTSFSTLSSGGQISQAPSSPIDTLASLSPLSSGQIPQTPTSLEPSSPPPPAPEPIQNDDGTWACPQSGCTHPGHKRRCDARKHYKSHTKPYACRVNGCEYRSSNAKDRERHYDTRHAKTRHPACPAPGCGVLKSRVDNMRDHIRRKHPEMDHKSPEVSALYPRRGRS